MANDITAILHKFDEKFFEASKENNYTLQFVKKEVYIYSTKLINKSMFQVSNKRTQKSYELGSKFK